MKALIVYDSVYGHTEKIAQTIGTALTNEYDVEVVKANKVRVNQLPSINLLIIGSPTHGGRFTEAIQNFLNDISELILENIKTAAFDTRTSSSGIVGVLERKFGHAAVRIVNVLKKQGRILAAEPEGFIVKGRKGPLKEGELERAKNWALKLGINKGPL
jgi:flavodoxin